MAMYPCTKFDLIWRTSDFGTKLPPPPPPPPQKKKKITKILKK